jgi:integrase
MTRPDGSQVYAAATIGRRAAAVSTVNAALTAGRGAAALVPPVGQYPVVRKALAGMRRRRKGTRPARADPLLLEDVRLLCSAIAASGTTWSRRVRARRDTAVVTALMAGAYRRSELAAHTLGDVTYHPGAGLHLYVPFSKTDQEGTGLVKALPAGTDPLTCPRCAMLKWIAVVAAWDSAGRPGLIRLLAAPDEPGHVCEEPRVLPAGTAPLLRGVDRSGRLTAGGLSGHAVNDIVQDWWEAAGPGDGRRITSHSGRVGFVTEGFRAGAAANEIARQTGHQTTRQVEEYRREHVPEAGNAVTRIGF